MPVIVGGDEFAAVIDDTDVEVSALELLRIDNVAQGVTELDEREVSRHDANQLTPGIEHGFSDDDARIEGRFLRNAHLKDRPNRSNGRAGTLNDIGRCEFRSYYSF